MIGTAIGNLFANIQQGPGPIPLPINSWSALMLDEALAPSFFGTLIT